MKKIMTVILSILMIITIIFSFSGCIFEEGPIMTYGDFTYCYVRDADQNSRSTKVNGKYIAILELTEEGQQKETIVIPETIEGKTVILIGMSGLFWEKDLRTSGGVYNKIYLPPCLQQVRGASDLFPPIKKFLIKVPEKIFFQNISGVYYVPEVDFYKYQKYMELNHITISVANLTYMVDGEVYWIDDYDNGEYIKFPQTPQKEGYIFDGWYKEPEYLIEWNETLDQYSKSKDNKTMNLYAKWIEE